MNFFYITKFKIQRYYLTFFTKEKFHDNFKLSSSYNVWMRPSTFGLNVGSWWQATAWAFSFTSNNISWLKIKYIILTLIVVIKVCSWFTSDRLQLNFYQSFGQQEISLDCVQRRLESNLPKSKKIIDFWFELCSFLKNFYFYLLWECIKNVIFQVLDWLCMETVRKSRTDHRLRSQRKKET